MQPIQVLLGVLIEVHPGQAVRVQPFDGRDPMDIFVMDPEPYRGHEGEALIMDFDEGLVPVRIMGAGEQPSFVSSVLESMGKRETRAETRAYDSEDARREAVTEMFKRHVKAARPDSSYDADIEYMEHAIIAFADEWSGQRLREG